MKSLEKSFIRKAKVYYFISAIVVLFISTSLVYSFYRRSEKNDIIMKMSFELALGNHVSPPEINDQFSEKVFDAYLKKIDLHKWFLTKEDIGQMEVYKRQISGQIKGSTYQLYDLSVKLIDIRTREVQGYYREILSQPLDFSIDETWEADFDKRDFPANSAGLKENWRKLLKAQVISHIANALRAQEKETDPSKIKTFETIETEARERVLKFFNDRFNNNLEHQKPEGRFSMYVNAIMDVFDPHSTYYAPREKENFDIRMSGQLEGIGAVLTPSDGYARVERIVLGSPSWLQGELKVNDHITKVQQEHEDEPVDIFGMSLDDAVSLIRGKKGTKVTLTVRRADGSIREITITRDVVIEEETYAKSAILTDPETKVKAGYIYLPSFYVDFRRRATGRASSNDVAKEIEKLKNDGVQGIILDLRTNGGGSLSDAINIGRLFVPPGPIVQVKSNIEPPRILYPNINPSGQYDDPLVILVSSVSASASEILAAAMQDYKRAVIIGSPSTFGKGTVQQVVDLDELLTGAMNNIKPMGALALTIQKFYRINGGSVQLRGVESDIVLPDVFSELKIGERFNENHLTWTEVPAATYNIWKDPVPIDMLRKKSNERTSNCEGFKLLNEQVTHVREQRENTTLSLNLNTYRQEEEKRREENKRFEDINKRSTALSIAALSHDITEMQGDTAKIARSDKWLQDLNKDIFLEEAVKVIGDMR